jgi:hypothetical protein
MFGMIKPSLQAVQSRQQSGRPRTTSSTRTTSVSFRDFPWKLFDATSNELHKMNQKLDASIRVFKTKIDFYE